MRVSFLKNNLTTILFAWCIMGSAQLCHFREGGGGVGGK